MTGLHDQWAGSHDFVIRDNDIDGGTIAKTPSS
jgi:hypothetical protein